MFFRKRTLSLRKSRLVFKSGFDWYKKKGNKLSKEKLLALEALLDNLDQALLAKDRKRASDLAHKLEEFVDTHFSKSFFESGFELFVALGFALLIASLVHQTWWQLMEIPTGSMRPTFRERDRLTVTKTPFGINTPYMTNHFYFDPNLVQRASAVIFSADNLPIDDTDDRYFWIFPAKKRFIKRLIGKPGDSLYFYGGQIYGVDSKGNPLPELRDSPTMKKLEYVPFLSFEGEITQPSFSQTVYHQLNEEIGRITRIGFDGIKGEVYNGEKWVRDNPTAQNKPHSKIETYSDFFGMRNYATARLLTKKQLPQELRNIDLEEGILYLELNHTPSLTYPKPVLMQRGPQIIPYINPYKTVIPLQERHLDAIMNALYTARFVVEEEKGKNYSVPKLPITRYSPPFRNVPNGTYEFYNGEAIRLNAIGIETNIPKESALYSRNPENVQKLFNNGIYFNTLAPSTHRYAYFRDGALYLMGKPILEKQDPTLIAFNEREEEKAGSTYVPFRDYGPPKDAAFIRTFGVTVPSRHYLVLGDNHAMSSDSRVFGFLPEQNLEGAPSVIIWPPGKRWGFPDQRPYPFFNTPRTIVWTIVLIIALICYLNHRRKIKRPNFKKIHML